MVSPLSSPPTNNRKPKKQQEFKKHTHREKKVRSSKSRKKSKDLYILHISKVCYIFKLHLSTAGIRTKKK